MKFRLWINLFTFAAVAVIVVLAWKDIDEALHKITTLNYWVLLLMIPGQILVFFSLAKLFQKFFLAVGSKVNLKTLFQTALELNFVNHVFPSGGVSGFSYTTLRLKKSGVSTAKTTLAQLARFAACLVGFIILMIIALILLAIEDRTSALVVLIVSSLTSTILFGTGVLIYVISSEARVKTFAKRLVSVINYLIFIFRKKKRETVSHYNTEKSLMELHKDYMMIRGDIGKMGPMFMWAMILNTVEVGLLYVAFAAHGEFVNPGALIVAFVVANTAGLIAILPGGLGVYEPLMTAVLISGGIPAALALSATLVYRVISLILSLLFGLISYQIFIHKYGRADVQRK